MFEAQHFAAVVPGTGAGSPMTPMSFGARQTGGTAVSALAPVSGDHDPVRQITVAGGAPLALATPGRTLFETKQGNQTWMDTEK